MIYFNSLRFLASLGPNQLQVCVYLHLWVKKIQNTHTYQVEKRDAFSTQNQKVYNNIYFRMDYVKTCSALWANWVTRNVRPILSQARSLPSGQLNFVSVWKALKIYRIGVKHGAWVTFLGPTQVSPAVNLACFQHVMAHVTKHNHSFNSEFIIK